MNITYQVELLKDCLEEMKPLLQLHYEEIAMYKDKIKLSPNYDSYLSMEENEFLHVVTVRDDEVLVGYYINFILPHMHYKEALYACNDIVLILPEYRDAKIGVGLFKKVEEELTKLGVHVMTVHMKTAQPFDKLCEGLGYDYAERQYTKYIGE